MTLPAPQSLLAGTRTVPVERVDGRASAPREDAVAIEEPLEIRLAALEDDGPGRAISITMRTPGHDGELALGFLHGEGIIASAADIAEVRPCGPTGNVIRLAARAGLPIDSSRLERNFYTTSSCGVCGKTSIEAAISAVRLAPVPPGTLRVDPLLLSDLPRRMRMAQAAFDTTGGLHASALFAADGTLRLLREDVGRHNALDKVVGAALMSGWVPLLESILVLSGRASFELLQKSMAAQIPLVAAIGAPSSLAIELAEAARITLIGFLREGHFNIYTHGARCAARSAP